jgi:hypothetical protein
VLVFFLDQSQADDQMKNWALGEESRLKLAMARQQPWGKVQRRREASREKLD